MNTVIEIVVWVVSLLIIGYVLGWIRWWYIKEQIKNDPPKLERRRWWSVCSNAWAEALMKNKSNLK